MEPGEYAVRGGIVDIFPAGEPDPVRLDLFGDEVESIRRFDATTQRSTDRIDRLELRPVSEVSLDPASVSRFREAWRELFGPDAAKDPIYAQHLRRPAPSRAWSTGRRCSTPRWRPCSTTCRTPRSASTRCRTTCWPRGWR